MRTLPASLSESHSKPKALVSQSQMLMCLFPAAPPPAAGKGYRRLISEHIASLLTANGELGETE